MPHFRSAHSYLSELSAGRETRLNSIDLQTYAGSKIHPTLEKSASKGTEPKALYASNNIPMSAGMEEIMVGGTWYLLSMHDSHDDGSWNVYKVTYSVVVCVVHC